MTTRQNADQKTIIEKKAACNWNSWDVFFIIAPLVCIGLFPLGGLGYLRGRFEAVDSSPMSCMCYPVLGLFIFFCFVYGFIRLFNHWKRHTWMKKFIILVEIGIPIVFILVPFNLGLIMPGYKPFTYGFRDRIKSQADIQDIRNWLKTLSRKDCNGETMDLFSDAGSLKSYWPDKLEWPRSLKVFNPHYIELSMDENGNPRIRLTWGGPFGHWGIEIGMEDMEIPPSDLSQYGEFRLAVEPGVYVWHELQ
jgi:hypothetical protein